MNSINDIKSEIDSSGSMQSSFQELNEELRLITMQIGMDWESVSNFSELIEQMHILAKKLDAHQQES
ncbi:MAG: hypothetical protein V4471_03835 [Pseudomonadota bacterium]